MRRFAAFVSDFVALSFHGTMFMECVWRLAFGVWRLAFGVWRLAFGVWRLAFGVRRLAFGVRRWQGTAP
jgi:hypothetical protein